MSAQPALLDLQTLRRFIRAARDLLTSEVRRQAIAVLLFLLAFALSVNGLNVVNSYVGRDFMTAIAHREMAEFVGLAILYIGLFAAMTAVAVLYRFTEERRGLLWRSWLTRRVTERYLDGRTYLRLKSITLLHREDRLRVRLLSRIDELAANLRRITSVNRNLGFFTTGYNYLIQIIPTLIVAPRFIRGEVEFGVITQSAMAFAQLLGAFSLIINQCGSTSSFAAVVARLSALAGAIEGKSVDRPGIETVEDRDRGREDDGDE
jgi:ABC-type uncharacterized transport system fused permease/ATPase subunit